MVESEFKRIDYIEYEEVERERERRGQGKNILGLASCEVTSLAETKRQKGVLHHNIEVVVNSFWESCWVRFLSIFSNRAASFASQVSRFVL